MQMAELRTWPALRDLDPAVLRDSCMHLFRREWLDALQTLFTAGAPVPADPSACRLHLLVQGSAAAVVTRTAGDGKSGTVADSKQPQQVVLRKFHAKLQDMQLLLGSDALVAPAYQATLVCLYALMHVWLLQRSAAADYDYDN
jgi:hypothetical protein